ncbi:MFS transporter [Arthrobacter sp. RAF14]|uniref:MFS transporter n=1 Tax=Arthrobacter sp. RAF14 TaxID=3233051 RepID=UPI003F8F5A70
MHAQHRRLIAVTFSLLGLQVGVRAVQWADVAVVLRLSPEQLGISAGVGAAAGILTLTTGAFLIDRVGRRPLLLVGLVGAGVSFIANALVTDYVQFLLACVAYGLLISFLDLAANAIGSDFERFAGEESMVGFHSWFSLAAAVGASLSAVGSVVGAGFRPASALLGVALIVAGLWTLRQALPPVARADSTDGRLPGPSGVRLPATVLIAVEIVFLCFFGDGILETFLAVLVRHEAGTQVWLAGVTIAVFHFSSWLGRSISQRAVTRWGAWAVLLGAGAISALLTVASLWLTGDWIATLGFGLVGFALSPIVPLGMSLAGRSAPAGTEGRAIGLTNGVGYTAFIASPVVAGWVAEQTSMPWGVGLAALTMAGVSLAALALPGRSGVKERGPCPRCLSGPRSCASAAQCGSQRNSGPRSGSWASPG